MPVLAQQYHPDAWAQLTRTFPVTFDLRASEVRPGESTLFLNREGGTWTAQVGRWGLRPAGHARGAVYQAKVETLGAHRTFRDLLDSGRCVIPLAAYWDAPETTAALPVRVLVSPVTPAPLYAAGLYIPEWTPRGLTWACAVITRPAPPALAGTFTRMPALLREEELIAWMTAAPRAARQLARDSGAGSDLSVSQARVMHAATHGFSGP